MLTHGGEKGTDLFFLRPETRFINSAKLSTCAPGSTSGEYGLSLENKSVPFFTL